MKTNPTMINEERVRSVLFSKIRRRVGNSYLCEDLIEDALIHLAEEKWRHPGHTENWYIKSCYFHVLHEIERGCSVDSSKRHQRQSIATDQLRLTEYVDTQFVVEITPREIVCARDLRSRLFQRLNGLQTIILTSLMDGFRVAEIAKKLHTSHKEVRKQRRRIAIVAGELGGFLSELAINATSSCYF